MVGYHLPSFGGNLPYKHTWTLIFLSSSWLFYKQVYSNWPFNWKQVHLGHHYKEEANLWSFVRADDANVDLVGASNTMEKSEPCRTWRCQEEPQATLSCPARGEPSPWWCWMQWWWLGSEEGVKFWDISIDRSPEKKLLFFWILSKLPPPPSPPNLDNLLSPFPTLKFNI